MIDRLYVIPARMKSTRFPGKPLAKIWGKEMILLTYERILSAGINKENIVVAIDTDKDLMNLMIANDIKYEIINDAVTGTDRVAEVARRIEARYYINLQGDEPLMPVENILEMARFNFSNYNAVIGYSRIKSINTQNSPKVPKLVFSPTNRLLYISRSPIPGSKSDINSNLGFKQVCIYGFERQVLLKYYKNKKTPLEEIEDIEILRLLEYDVDVKCIEVKDSGISVDYREDIEYIEKNYEKNNYMGL